MTNLTQNSFLYIYFNSLHVSSCSSEEESVVSINLWQIGKEISDLHTKGSPTQSDIYQRFIDTVDSPDDEHAFSRNV
jgi:hypothetical protein